jgi:hypothetical protein
MHRGPASADGTEDRLEELKQNHEGSPCSMRQQCPPNQAQRLIQTRQTSLFVSCAQETAPLPDVWRSVDSDHSTVMVAHPRQSIQTLCSITRATQAAQEARLLDSGTRQGVVKGTRRSRRITTCRLLRWTAGARFPRGVFLPHSLKRMQTTLHSLLQVLFILRQLLTQAPCYVLELV